ncbi:MAG: U32 family peptidase [Clostridium sp.]
MAEILAPAGDFECLRAAVLNGADAVYIGGSEFSARKYASNFEREEIVEAVRFCHCYNVRLYVTLNTLLDDKECIRGLEYAKFLYEIGVDAVIVQDLGLLKLLRKYIPDLEVHASTQMSVHNLEGVNMLYDMGIKRVVLARELSIKEIKYIKENTKAELEVFVHGALCICFSGQCLYSSMIGGRSGNRGTCAQSCRMEYSLDGMEKSHILSPKDLSALEFITSLTEIGVDSLKIEGRMKRYEYVATVVSSYKKALEGVLEKRDVQNVTQIFNRGGFTSAFLHSKQGGDMMSYTRPKNWGLYLGDVLSSNGKYCDIKLHADLSKEDGVEIFSRDKGGKISKIFINGEEVTEAREGSIVNVYLEGAQKGDKIYKSSDTRVLNNAKDTIEVKLSPKRVIEGVFIAGIGQKPSLTINLYDYIVKKDNSIFKEGENNNPVSITVYGDECERALNKPTLPSKVDESLRKLKDTPFEFDNIYIDVEEGIIIPVSRINQMRRDAIEKLIDTLQGVNKIDSINIEVEDVVDSKPKKILVAATSINAAITSYKEGADIVFYGGDDLRVNRRDFRQLIDLKEKGINIYPWFSEIVIEEMNKVKKEINLLKENGIDKCLCSNLGIYNILKEEGFKVYLDKGFNVFNSYAVDTLENESSLLSPELNLKQLRNITSKTNHSTMLHVHGRQKLMVSRHCPVGSVKGEGKDSCSILCGDKVHYMKDRMGEEFLIYTDMLCRSHIYNSKTLCTLENMKDILPLKVEYLEITFLDENESQVRDVIRAYKDAIIRGENKDYLLEDCQNSVLDSLKGCITKGHFYRGVI